MRKMEGSTVDSESEDDEVQRNEGNNSELPGKEPPERGRILLEVENLKKYYPLKGGIITHTTGYTHAVDGVSFSVREGETLGLVGESGCGKTTTGRTLLRLVEPTGGKIVYDGETIFDSEKNIKKDMGPYRRKMQIVFQDPYASLDPRMTVGDIIGEGIESRRTAIPTSFPADSAREWALPGPWQ